MTRTPATDSRDFSELHLFARGVGLLAVLTALLYLRAIANGAFLQGGTDPVIPANALLFVLMLLATAGLVLSWRWECAGGIVAIFGSLAVAAVVFLTFTENRWAALLIYSSPFLISGLLCVADWWKARG